jgi:hypothetical protein
MPGPRSAWPGHWKGSDTRALALLAGERLQDAPPELWVRDSGAPVLPAAAGESGRAVARIPV